MINFKISISFLFVILIQMGCSQLTSEELMESAKKNVSEGDPKTAIINLKNAISADMNNPQARLMLANVYLSQGQLVGAEKEFRRVINFGGYNDEAVPKLAEVLFYLEDYEEVSEIPEPASWLESEAKSRFEMFKVFARFMMFLNDENLDFDTAYVSSGDQEKDIVSAINAYSKTEYQEALLLLENVPLESEVLKEKNLLSGLLHAERDEFDLAADSFKYVIKNQPFIGMTHFRLLDALVRSEQLESADLLVGQLLSANPKNGLANYYRALLLYFKNDFEQAYSFVEASVNSGLNTSGLNLLGGVIAFELEKWERSYAFLSRVDSGQSGNLDINRIMAALQLKLGYENEIYDTVAKIDSFLDEDAPFLTGLSINRLKNRKVEEAEELINLAGKLRPDDSTIKMQKGYIELVKDNSKSAQQIFRDLVSNDNSKSEAWIFLAASYVKSGEFDKALEVADKWKAHNEVDAYVLEGSIYKFQKQIDKALEAFNNAIAIESSHRGANLYKLELLTKSNEIESAYEQSKRFIDIASDREEGYRYLLSSGIKLDKNQEVVDLLSEKSTNDKTNNLIKEFYGVSLLYSENIKQGVDILESLSSMGQTGYIELGNAYTFNGEHQKSIALFSKWKDKHPKYLLPWVRYIGSLELDGKIKEAKEAALNARELLGDRPMLLLLSMNLNTNTNNLEEAGKLSEKLDTIYQPGDSQVYDKFKAELALKQKNYSSAEELSRLLYSALPNFENAIRLTKSLRAQDKIVEGGKVLEKALENADVHSGYNYHVTAEYFVMNELYEQAEIYYLKQIEFKLDDMIALNNLAEVKMHQKDFEKAIDYSKRALEIAPKIPQLQDTYGWILYNSGQIEEGFDKVYQAHLLAPEDNNIKLHLAEISIAKGNTELAEKLLAKLKAQNNKQLSQQKRLKDLL